MPEQTGRRAHIGRDAARKAMGMTQRVYDEASKFQVTAGWDRSLQYFFLTILAYEKIHEDTVLNEDEPVFCNLDRVGKPGMAPEEVKMECLRHGIHPPQEFWDDLLEDQRLDRGNDQKYYAGSL
jgi:hypothetical protein